MIVGVLTVSDRCAAGAAPDKSGPAVVAALEAAAPRLGAAQIVTACVADDALAIQRVVKRWVDYERVSLVLTTGGTGFAPRDITPEAVRVLLDKEAPGLAQHMLAQSLAITPMAVLSRAVCGVRGGALVVTLPGSPKGAVECLGFLLPVLPHALQLLAGETTTVAAVHAHMQEAAAPRHETPRHETPRHSCTHRSDDVSAVDSDAARAGLSPLRGVADRPRASLYPMVAMPDALAVVAEQAVAAGAVRASESHPVQISDALGAVLADAIRAPGSLPPFAASVKDGYAVIAADCPGDLSVLSSVTAGDGGGAAVAAVTVVSGTTVRITTGAPMPAGADAVVQVEDTELVARAGDGLEEKCVRIGVAAAPGLDVRPIGSDVAAGQLLLPAGHVIGPADMGLLAGSGLTTVRARLVPTVAVMSTGDEVVEAGAPLRGGQIWDSNRPTLLAAARAESLRPIDLGIVPDTAPALEAAIHAAAHAHDVLVTSGGVSMGEKDLLKSVILRLGGTIHFGRVRMKPGKPTTFATLPRGGTRGPCLVFALPGNPVSCAVGFYLFVLPALRILAGKPRPTLPRLTARLTSAVELDPRPEYQRGVVEWALDGGGPRVTPVEGSQASSCLPSMTGAEVLLALPGASVAQPRLMAGAVVDVLMLPSLFHQ